jgi:hypothetical protein
VHFSMMNWRASLRAVDVEDYFELLIFIVCTLLWKMGFFGPPPGSNIKRPGGKGDRQRNVGKGARQLKSDARDRGQAAEEPEESPRTYQSKICEVLAFPQI